MFKEVYEIRLNERIVELDKETWDKVREAARAHKFFILVHMDEHYKYVKAQTFYDRPTRFEFRTATEEDKEIQYIYI